MSQTNVVNLRDAALSYARQGLRIFPCGPGVKQPVTANGFHDATNDLDIIERWWTDNPARNIAIRPADARLFVVDIDPEYEGGLPDLPPTFTVRTPRGGWHYYYESDEEFPNRKPVKGVDFRSGNGYVLVAPSVTEAGTYEVVDNRAPVPLPHSIRGLADHRAERKEAAPDLELDQPQNVERARQLMAQQPLAFEGDGSDAATLQLAQRILDLGLSADGAVNIMWPWAARCGFDQDWLETKIHNAFKYRQNDPGCHAAPDLTQNPAYLKLAEDMKPPGLAWESGASIKASEVEPVREIIPGWLERGISTFLVGVGGVHKSRLALQWAKTVAEGQPVFGKPVEQCDFFFLSYEDDRNEIIRRWHAIDGGLNLKGDKGEVLHLRKTRPPLAIISESGITLTDFWHQLKERLKEEPGHKVLVIDSCYNAFLFQGQAKINETLVGQVVAMIDQLCEDCDCTIIILWHPSSAGAEEGKGWSEAWNNAPRRKLQLKAGKGGEFTLTVQKANNVAKGHHVSLFFENGVLVPADLSKSAETLRVAAVAVAKEMAGSTQHIKLDGKIGTHKITEESPCMTMLRQRTGGIEYSVKQFLEALAAAKDLGELSITEQGYS